jgi:branched-chain amino acid transport system permease protein
MAASTATAGAFQEWMRRKTWVDFALLAIRACVAGFLVSGCVLGLLANRYSIENWLSFAVFGLIIGSIYALIALGYTMVYGILRMINFAHADVMMVGSYAGMFVATSLQTQGLLQQAPLLLLPVIMAAGMAAGALVSLGIERVAYRPFLHVRSLAPLICAIGLTFVIEYSARGLFGTRNRAYPSFGWMEQSMQIGPLSVPIQQVVSFAAAVIMLAGLMLIVYRTRLGKSMRAVSEDRDAAALSGINVGRVIVLTFALGGAMAGVAGILYGLVFKQIQVFMGFSLGIKGFAAAILGGIGNLPGALLGGLVLGMSETLGPALLFEGFGVPAPYQLRDVIGYGMLVMILIFRPQGILGERLASKRA